MERGGLVRPGTQGGQGEGAGTCSDVDRAVERQMAALRLEVEDKLAAMESEWRSRYSAMKKGYELQIASLHGVCKTLEAKYRRAKQSSQQAAAPAHPPAGRGEFGCASCISGADANDYARTARIGAPAARTGRAGR